MSRVAQRLVEENASVVRTPPGAAWKSSYAASLVFPPRMSHSSSQACSDGAWTACTESSSIPARFNSPMIATMPPARWTSSM
ncbi:MAG: hypothetical protein BWY91_03274 [bacterium ADurb.BinA028]|nr:MAG: hypothetical protein BWY91_03274 [bacterium ADurb.BinA028]